MKTARILIILIGILLPFIARIPGVFIKGKSWFTCYFDGGIGGVAFIAGLQSLCWGSILLSSFTYRQPSALWFPAALGFAFVALAHAFLDLNSSSTAAIGLAAIPVMSLPIILIGWMLGLWFQR
jgi:hypothetical protein